MIRKIAVISVLLFYSCQKDPVLWKVDNLGGDSILVFGHGGMGVRSRYPIDSYESIQEAMSMGADGSEMDLQLSKDSVLVLYHDLKLEDVTSGKGYIYDHNWSDIKDCEYKSLTVSTIKLVDLGTLFEKLPGKDGKTFTFDCKLNGRSDTVYLNHFANAIIKHINKYSPASNFFIESTDTSFIRILHNKKPALKLFYYTGDFKLGYQVSDKLPLYGLTFKMSDITKTQIEQAHQKNLRITLFDQQTENENLEAIQMSPDFIQTDKVEHALKIFGRYKK